MLKNRPMRKKKEEEGVGRTRGKKGREGKGGAGGAGRKGRKGGNSFPFDLFDPLKNGGAKVQEENHFGQCGSLGALKGPHTTTRSGSET